MVRPWASHCTSLSLSGLRSERRGLSQSIPRALPALKSKNFLRQRQEPRQTGRKEGAEGESRERELCRGSRPAPSEWGLLTRSEGWSQLSTPSSMGSSGARPSHSLPPSSPQSSSLWVALPLSYTPG